MALNSRNSSKAMRTVEDANTPNWFARSSVVDDPDKPTLIADLLCPNGYSSPVERRIMDIATLGEKHSLAVFIYQFSEVPAGKSLRDHVKDEFDSPTCPGPWMESSLKFATEHGWKNVLQLPKQSDVYKASAAYWSGDDVVLPSGRVFSMYRSHQWHSSLKTLIAGDFGPYSYRAIAWSIAGKLGREESTVNNLIHQQIVLIGDDGKRYWGMLMQLYHSSYQTIHDLGLRDLQILRSTPAALTSVCGQTGRIVTQNSASMAMIGCQGAAHYEANVPGAKFSGSWNGDFYPKTLVVKLLVTDRDNNGCHRVSLQIQPAMSGQLARAHVETDLSYIDLLLNCDQAKMQDLNDAAGKGGTYNARIEIAHPILRSFMRLKEGSEVYHDIQVTGTQDPINHKTILIISQVDVTETVIAKRQLQQAHDELADEKERMDALLQRQHELIECLGKVNSVTGSVGNHYAAQSTSSVLMDNVRAHMTTEGSGSKDAIELQRLLGQGSFGKVYKGLWRGTTVAVKIMVMPNQMSDVEKRHRMAIMEAAISSSLSHPNIVQTYTYSMKPIKDLMARGSTPMSSDFQAEQGQGDRVIDTPGAGYVGILRNSDDPSPRQQLYQYSGFEVQLVLEYCNYGSLQRALQKGVFYDAMENGYHVPNYVAVLEIASDVAKGMLHLHTQNVVHSDLKVGNIMLQSSVSNVCGAVAKIADFGMSIQMDAAETHVSQWNMGTLSHMAPELLLYGHQSKAADVYAFGIVLWELWTARRPYKGVPKALLGHKVAREHLRPQFPVGSPIEYVALTERCWDFSPTNRPVFADIVAKLRRMLERFKNDCVVDRLTVEDVGMNMDRQEGYEEEEGETQLRVQGSQHRASAAGGVHNHEVEHDIVKATVDAGPIESSTSSPETPSEKNQEQQAVHRSDERDAKACLAGETKGLTSSKPVGEAKASDAAADNEKVSKQVTVGTSHNSSSSQGLQGAKRSGWCMCFA